MWKLLGCAITFCLLGLSCQYDLGVTFQYNYETHFIINEDLNPSNGQGLNKQDVGYKITAKVHVTCIWESSKRNEEKLLKVELINPKLHVPKKLVYQIHSSKLDTVAQSPIYLQWENGKVNTLYADPKEDWSVKNLKKGIGSLLQFHKISKQVEENDISGRCKTFYETDGKSVKKRKENCIYPNELQQFSHSNELRSATIILSSETHYKLHAEKNCVILSANGKDYINMYSNMWKRPTVSVISEVHLELENEKPGSSTVEGETVMDAVEAAKASFQDSLKAEDLAADLVSKDCLENCKNLIKAISGYQENLKTKNLASLKSASTFLKLLEHFRAASKEDIINVLKHKKFEVIMPQLLDVISAAQTVATMEAALGTLDFSRENIDILERYFLSLSAASHPTEQLLQRILEVAAKKVKNEKLHATVIITLGALAKTYSRTNKELTDNLVLQNIKDFLVKELDMCKSDICKLMYLRGLRNAALPATVPLLLEYAKKGGKTAVEALLALKNIGTRNLPSEAVEVFHRVFHEIGRRQDSSSRAIAAELLLISHPSKEMLKNFVASLANQDNPEVRTFAASKLLEIMKNEHLRNDVVEVLGDKDVNYYYSLSQKGSSALFTKPLVAATGVNTTYGVSMEMISGGLLKRSSFDVHILSPESSLHVLSVGMFADGLSSFAGGGGDTSNDDQEEEATAGMELTILGVNLRPYVFFRGTGELMGHVWSGTGSELTPAMQANLLLIEHSKIIPLQSGFVVSLNLRGVLSSDLSASIQISLWNRNSHSLVKNAAALVVKGSAEVDASFALAQGEFTFMGQSAIDFSSDLDFYEDPFKMCVQMDQPEFVFRFNMQKMENIPGSKHSVKKYKRRKLYIPARSYTLHKKNNEQCASMLGPDS